MRKKKVLVVIALVLFALFQAQVASACQAEALVYRVDLLDFGVRALIYLSLVNQIGPADIFMETDNIAIISLALAAVHSYNWVYFEGNAPSCPAFGFAGLVLLAIAYNQLHQLQPL
jgi:hypothetical protein